MGLGWQELLIVLLIAVLLFGGSKLAGLGKATGKAIREFREETHDLSAEDKKKKGISTENAAAPAPQPGAPQTAAPQQIPQAPYQPPVQQPYQPSAQPTAQQSYQAPTYQQNSQQYSRPQQIVDGEIVDPGQNS